MKPKKETALEKRARQLLRNPLFFYRAGQAISDLGVVGEDANRLIVLLACISRELPEPISILIKGPSSSGKSNLVKQSLQLFPRKYVLERASLSGKAPAHSEESFEKKILFIQEYRGGKDAQLLIRLLQTEGRIAHEYTSVLGRHRGTEIAEQTGRPVVITTTTDHHVFPDDSTRFLSVWIDESAAQTAAIVKAQVCPCRTSQTIKLALRVWRKALSLTTRTEEDFQSPPAWLMYVAEQLPTNHVRVRRDWRRFLTFCSAAALIGRPSVEKPVNIKFSDYAIIYKILEPALAATTHDIHPRELAVVRAVEALATKDVCHVTVRAIAEFLGWKEPLVYKYVKRAQDHHRIVVQSGNERNQKIIVPNSGRSTGFLPRPSQVFRNNKELGKSVSWFDPFTGKLKVLNRD